MLAFFHARARLVLGGFIASLLTLAAIALPFLVRGSLQQPEDFLNAKNVIAVIRYPLSPDLHGTLNHMFPMLRDAPTESGSILALLRYPDGDHWIAFTRGDNGKNIYEGTVGRYSFQTSGLEKTWITNGRDSNLILSRNPAYDALPHQPNSVALRKDALPTEQTLVGRIAAAALLSDAAWMQVRDDRKNRVLALAGSFENIEGTGVEMPDSKGVKEVLALNDPKGFFRDLNTMLAHDDAALLESIVRKHVRDVFGSDVSFTYDILPLLQTPAMLMSSASGGFLLAGSAEEDLLQAILPRLHASVRTVLPRMTIKRYEIGQFSAHVVMEDQGGIIEETWTTEGYDITRTGPKNGSGGFLTAVRDTFFFLSNERSLLEAHLLPLGHPFPGDGHVQAGGIVSKERIAPFRARSPLFSFLPADTSIRFSVLPVDHNLKFVFISW